MCAHLEVILPAISTDITERAAFDGRDVILLRLLVSTVPPALVEDPVHTGLLFDHHDTCVLARAGPLSCA